VKGAGTGSASSGAPQFGYSGTTVSTGAPQPVAKKELLTNPETGSFSSSVSVDSTSLEPALSYEAKLASLNPIERWKYIAKHNKGDLFFGILAFFLSVGALASSLLRLIPEVLGSAASAASAEGKPSFPVHELRGHDLIDWFVVFAMGVILAWSLWMSSKSGATKENVTFARENLRTFTGALLGFLGGKVR
jgi:hypothetical protein